MYTFDAIFSSPTSKMLIPILSLFLVPLFLRYIENKYWSLLSQKKNVWKRFLYKNKSIRKCFTNYNDIESETYISIKFTIGISILFTFFFISLIVISASTSLFLYGWIIPAVRTFLLMEPSFTSFDNVYQYVALTINLIFTYFLLNYCSNEINNFKEKLNQENILQNYSNIKKLYYIAFFVLLIQFLIILSLFLETNNTFLKFTHAISVIVLCVYFVSIPRIFMQSSTKKVKEVVNDNFSRRFPLLDVSTMGAEHYFGMLKNIFNDEAIILIQDGIETLILWDSVASVTEMDNKDEEQKRLSDF